jgi:hypothetical protein
MRRFALALVVSLTACDSEPLVEEEAPLVGEESSSGGLETDGETDGGEESSSGGDAWAGEVTAIRTLRMDLDGSCAGACGTASVCIAGKYAVGGADVGCTEATGPKVCTCADDVEASSVDPTHAIGECFMSADLEPSGFSMSRPEKWHTGTCADYCAENGLGPCAWTQWARSLECPDWVGNAWVRQHGDDMTTRTPFAPGDGGVLRFVCEI